MLYSLHSTHTHLVYMLVFPVFRSTLSVLSLSLSRWACCSITHTYTLARNKIKFCTCYCPINRVSDFIFCKIIKYSFNPHMFYFIQNIFYYYVNLWLLLYFHINCLFFFLFTLRTLFIRWKLIKEYFYGLWFIFISSNSFVPML